MTVRPWHRWFDSDPAIGRATAGWRHSYVQCDGFVRCDCPDISDIRSDRTGPLKGSPSWRLGEISGHVGNPGLSSLDYGERE